MKRKLIFYKETVSEDEDWITDTICSSLHENWRYMCTQLMLLGKPYPTIEDYFAFMKKHYPVIGIRHSTTLC